MIVVKGMGLESLWFPLSPFDGSFIHGCHLLGSQEVFIAGHTDGDNRFGAFRCENCVLHVFKKYLKSIQMIY